MFKSWKTPGQRQKMASQAPDVTSTCLICYETRVLKIVGNCKHCFCTECLSTVFESQDSGSEVFECPTCKVDCPRPWDGLQGLVDYRGRSVDAEDMDPVVIPKENETEKKRHTTETTVDVICDICVVQNIEVEAANTCFECDNLNICADCSKTHGKNRATCSHLLTPVVRVEKNMKCKTHKKLLISFCQTCGVEACNVCVSIYHGDHNIERLGDTIRSNVKVMRVALLLRERKLKEMQDLQEELTILKAMAPIVDKQDTLIKEIEDHAQRCVDQIMNWKEDLKAQVKTDYQIVREIPECLERVREAVQQLQPQINEAPQLLSKTEHHPAYLNKLKTMQRDFEATATVGDDVKGRQFREELFDLNSNDYQFDLGALQPNHIYGKIRDFPKSDRFQPREIFKHEMPVYSSKMFIPCVAVLGPKYYAVAHPVKFQQPAEAVDFYEFPGVLKFTLKYKVPPLYDMTSTPDGKLAVLSDGKGFRTCSIKLFDAEAGYIRSTRDIGVAIQPLSLGVTLLKEYVILGRDEEERTQINVVDEDGRVVHIYVIDQATDFESKTIQKIVTRADLDARISTRDGYNIVMSCGQTIKVYRCD
ncbi:uncharacterized protein LOC135488076 [Lineus longissimus]|uniref:uncharacterized protein LOC135488076 n=1 Tax=Lineus longissimus TaxID=88925 RepID=UPI00315DF6CE